MTTYRDLCQAYENAKEEASKTWQDALSFGSALALGIGKYIGAPDGAVYLVKPNEDREQGQVIHPAGAVVPVADGWRVHFVVVMEDSKRAKEHVRFAWSFRKLENQWHASTDDGQTFKLNHVRDPAVEGFYESFLRAQLEKLSSPPVIAARA